MPADSAAGLVFEEFRRLSGAGEMLSIEALSGAPGVTISALRRLADHLDGLSQPDPEYHASCLRRISTQIEMVRVAERLADDPGDPLALDTLNELRRRLGQGKDGLSTFRAEDFADPESSILPMEWLLPNWVEHGDSVIFAGDPGSGKSLMCLSAILSLAAGVPVLDLWHEQDPMPVAILDLESRGRVLKRRLWRLAAGLNIDLIPLLNKNLHVISLRDQPYDPKSLFSDVRNVLIAQNPSPRVLLIDTLFAATTQEGLNPLEGYQWIRNTVFPLGREINCSIWLIHHLRKPDARDGRAGEGGRSVNEVSGGGFANITDATIAVWSQGEGKPAVVTNPKQRHSRNQGKHLLKMEMDEDPVTGPLRLTLWPMSATGISHSDKQIAALQAVTRLLSKTSVPVTRTEAQAAIARELEVGERSARRYCEELLQAGQLIPTGEAKDGAGRPVTTVGLPGRL